VLTASELAHSLGLDPKHLRHLIREHRLVPSHPHNARYELDDGDVARIRGHEAVRAAVSKRRANRR
jgi:predicted site-specific integrase-resolvase